jgi:hypothetical protein
MVRAVELVEFSVTSRAGVLLSGDVTVVEADRGDAERREIGVVERRAAEGDDRRVGRRARRRERDLGRERERFVVVSRGDDDAAVCEGTRHHDGFSRLRAELELLSLGADLGAPAHPLVFRHDARAAERLERIRKLVVGDELTERGQLGQRAAAARVLGARSRRHAVDSRRAAAIRRRSGIGLRFHAARSALAAERSASRKRPNQKTDERNVQATHARSLLPRARIASAGSRRGWGPVDSHDRRIC